MRTDRYTKTVLTVIAACLTIIVLGQFGLVAPVKADTGNGREPCFEYRRR